MLLHMDRVSGRQWPHQVNKLFNNLVIVTILLLPLQPPLSSFHFLLQAFVWLQVAY